MFVYPKSFPLFPPNDGKQGRNRREKVWANTQQCAVSSELLYLLLLQRSTLNILYQMFWNVKGCF
jgi:hypothetical protein